jgi:hypothetical protein
MAEFLRDATAPGPEGDLPAASASWQRAVDVATAEEPDTAREPRIKQVDKAILTDARHPFFWAGYMLFDSGSGVVPDEAPRPAAR